MSPEIVVALIFVSLLLLLVLGIPIAFSLFGLAMIVVLILSGPKMLPVGYVSAFSVITTEVFIALPLFVFMAGVLEFSGIISDLYNMAYKWFGPLRGGLAIGTIFTAVLIDAMSGLGATATITLGILALPEMLKRGYDKDLALGCIPAGGVLGPVIPPSVAMIILAGVTHLSIGKLFIAGVFPGLLIAGLYCIYILIRCGLNASLAPSLPREERANWAEKLRSLRYVILPIVLIISVLGSIYAGITTVTEAAGVGAFGALICAAMNRRLNWQALKQAMFMSAKVVGMTFWLIIGGMTFSHILHITALTEVIQNAMLAITANPLITVMLMLVVAIILGMFIDVGANILICVPIFWPMVLGMPNVDPLWWGMLFILTVCLGNITPPFGMVLFYLKGIAPSGITLGDIYHSIFPFCIIYVIGIAIVFAFPAVAIWLPALIMK